MPSGLFWNPWCRSLSRVGVPSSTPAGRSSTLSGMCCAPVVPGVSCLMTCRAGNWRTIISEFGSGKEPGSRFTMPSCLGPAKLEVTTHTQRGDH